MHWLVLLLLVFSCFLTQVGCWSESISNARQTNHTHLDDVEPNYFAIKKGFLVRSDKSSNVYDYHLGRITSNINSFESGKSIPLLVDGKLMPPQSTFYTMRIKFDPSLLEEGKVYHVRDLPSSFELSWRTSEYVPSGSSDCPKEVVVNGEGDTICGLNWMTHTILGGEGHKASFTVKVKKATTKRLSIILDMDAYSTRLNAGGELRYCCSLAQVNVDEPIDSSGEFLSNVDPFVLAYYCKFNSISETVQSGCRMIERD